MNRELTRAIEKLERAVQDTKSCDYRIEIDNCDVPALQEAARELLDELRRAGLKK